MLRRWYEWLFSEEEREPISFIETFFLILIMSTVVSAFVFATARHLMY
tara:strand:+ start:606 stop:749 length:144 start_codon:yes stop_codon:yes gene_type:complete